MAARSKLTVSASSLAKQRKYSIHPKTVFVLALGFYVDI
jgi:hypothetical protein